MRQPARRQVLLCSLLLALSPPADAGFRDWDDSEINDMIDKVTEAKDRAVEISNRVRSGVNELTSEIRDAISEGVDDLKANLSDEIDGRSTFLGAGGDCLGGSPCAQFRSDLVDLLENMEMLTNTMFGLTPTGADLDLSRTIDLIRKVPGRGLFPLYRALAQGNHLFTSSFVSSLGDLSSDLLLLQRGLENQGSAAARTAAPTPQSCQSILDDPESFEAAAFRVTTISGALKLVGILLIGAGETSVDSQAGIHGYVHISMKNNRTKNVGIIIDGTADLGFAYASYASNKLRYCTVLQGQEETRGLLAGSDGVLEILKGIDQLADPDQLDRILAGQAETAARQEEILRRQEEILRRQEEILSAVESLGPPWGKAVGKSGARTK